MPVIISPDTALGKELARWNTPRNRPVMDSSGDPVVENGTTLMGMGAVGYEPYPKMLYRAQTHPVSKQVRSYSPEPDMLDYTTSADYERALNQISRHNTACTKVVHDEAEYRRAISDGWRESPGQAMEAAEARAIEISDLAARRHYTDRTMSEPAQREAADADRSAGMQHVLDVQPRKRGRKPKAITASGEVPE